MAAALSEGRRSWRGTPRGTVVRRSRNLWRWLLSAVAISCIGAAIYLAWPRPVSRTALLVLTAEREERTAPLVPYVAGDRQALLNWAAAVNMPVSERPLSALKNAAALGKWLKATEGGQERLEFARTGKATGTYQLGKGDRLLVYIKGHAIALDVADGDKPDVRPLIIKSLSESDLAGAWYQDEANVLDISALLGELARLSDLQIFLVLDVVHVNYDPRLGIVLNAFPLALRSAAKKISEHRHLSVIVAQGDGELSAPMPGAGRSVFADSFVRALERQKGDASAIAASEVFDRVQSRLDQLNRGGRGSFRQSIQKVLMPAAGSQEMVFILPTSPPPETDELKAGDKASTEVTNAIKSEAERAVPVPTEVTTVVQAAKEITGAKTAPQSESAPPVDPNATKAEEKTAATAKSDAQPAPAKTELPPPTDLEIAWSARDRLQGRYRTGWSPGQVAPRHWRRVEAVLAGFDEEMLPADQKPRDPETLANLARDLQRLDAVFGGQRELPSGADCRAIAEALAGFLEGPASSFQARQPRALDEANGAVKVFAEGFFRAFDYIRLHGQTAHLPDGGPLLNDALLETLLSRLAELRRALSPVGLEDGRLDEARSRELARLASEVDQTRQRLNDEITAYVASTVAAPSSPGRSLRARLLLHSPVLSAAERSELRRPPIAPVALSGTPLVASPASFGQRLATNAKLNARLMQIAEPLGKRDSPAREGLLTELANVDPKTEPLKWTGVGRRLRLLAQRGTDATRVTNASRSPPGDGPQPLDLYLQELLVDGRDAHRAAATSQNLVTLVQPLRAARLADTVELKFSPERLQLASPSAEGATVQLALQVTSEQQPPYNIKLDLAWDARDITVTRQGGGSPLRSGVNEIRLAENKEVVELLVRPRHESTSDSLASLSATASFASSGPARTELACVLPRPDLLELTIAADNNLPAAGRRSWLPSGQQGGRLKLFPNRESTLSLYLANLSSEDKRVFARLYRVPRSAVDSSGRLFDSRSLTQLAGAAAALDAKLVQPGAEAAQLRRSELLAQSNEKEPLVLPAGSSPVKVPLAAIAPAQPMPPPAGAAAAGGEEGKEVTGGLVLVLASADGKTKPYVKWIELQIHQPDDLLEIREPALREGRLTFRAGLKNTSLVDEMELGKKPLAVHWDAQPLPTELRPTKREDLLTAEGEAVADFSGQAGANVPWPVYLHLQTDGYPRGLVSRLSWRGTQANIENLKVNHPPVVQVTRVAAAAQRANAPPEKIQFLSRPESAWLPYPSAQAIAEGLRVRRPGEPLLVRIDERAPLVRVDCDLAADIAPRYFADDARLRISLDGQIKEFAADRQIAMRLAGIEEGGLRLASQVTDFESIQFDPIDVPQDRRLELAAEVSGTGNLGGPGSALTDSVTIVLDRTPPKTNELFGQKLPLRPPTMPGAPPPTVIAMQCHANDGVGSGVAKVEFVVGFDTINNGRLDPAERRPPEPGRRVSEGAYAAEYTIEGTPPGEALLIEATATDNVGQSSEPITYRVALPRATQGGGQRTTFGSKPVEPEEPQNKKRK